MFYAPRVLAWVDVHYMRQLQGPASVQVQFTVLYLEHTSTMCFMCDTYRWRMTRTFNSVKHFPSSYFRVSPTGHNRSWKSPSQIYRSIQTTTKMSAKKILLPNLSQNSQAKIREGIPQIRSKPSPLHRTSCFNGFDLTANYFFLLLLPGECYDSISKAFLVYSDFLIRFEAA